MPGIVAANWKMNASRTHVQSFVAQLAEAWDDAKVGTTRALIFPPAGYLSLLVEELGARGLTGKVEVGGQTLHASVEGAYTGEMSGAMLTDLGARWVIVGHSERRTLFGESDVDVADKTAAALDAGLNPIVCCGESIEQRDAGQAEQTVLAQVQHLADALGAKTLEQLALAYEPIWAIGTGRTASPEQAQDMHRVIREQIALDIPVLYGGSVKPDNAAALFAQPDIDGGLVGGAALEAGSFWQIIEAAGAA